MTDSNLEVEVKFLVTDFSAIQQALSLAGAKLIKPRVYERNVRFDTADDKLLSCLELLRLRQDSAVRVTFKGPSVADLLSEAKVREELEMEVGDFETAVAIFTRLGFPPQQLYEKYRETWQLDTVEIVLDEMPFGNFIELEGSETAIKQAASDLGLDWQKRILGNYLGLMAQLKAFHNLAFNDLTFENFAKLPISIADILPT